MSVLRELLTRVTGLWRRRRGSDLDDELRFHLEMLEAQLRRGGMSAPDARREARARLGGLRQVAEAYDDQRTLLLIESCAQDLWYGARMLRRAPGFTAAALVTLALGIGATTAIFSIVHTVLLQPLPYADPDRLVAFGDADADGQPTNIGFTTWQDYRDRARTLEQAAVVRTWSPTLVDGGDAERVPAMRVSWNYFDMLGVRPALGRGFRPDEDKPEHWRVLLISDALWRRRFSADPLVVGRTISMNDRAYQIVGVLPADYEPLVSQHFYQRADMWAPLGYDTTLNEACRSCRHLRALGRIRAGATMSGATAELNAIRAQMAAEHPSDYPRGEVRVVRLQEKLAGPIRGTLLMLLGAVAFVLLIACANVANLLLARGVRRSREMTVRAALGAGRLRLVRQLLTENLLLSTLGGALGVGLAAVGTDALVALAPVTIPRMDRIAVDGWVLAFAMGVSVATGLAFGALPAMRSVAPELFAALGRDSRSTVGSGRRARQLLVIADVALALVLVAGAGLMLKSVGRLMRVDPGFDPRGVLTVQYSLVGARYAEDAAVMAFTNQVVERVTAMPGVEAAAVAGQIPMGGNGDTWGFHIEGRMSANPAEDPSVERYAVTPDYFRVMRIPLESGRLIADTDTASSMPVLVVSDATARALWPGTSPIGQRVRIGDALRGPWRTIVGVSGDVRHARLDAPPTLQMYVPQAQLTDSFVVLTVRARDTTADRLMPAIRAVLQELDPTVPIYQVSPLEDLVARSVAPRRFVLGLLSGFAGLALVLAAVGLYGVVSYTVSQRTREVGVRMALGATSSDILWLVIGGGTTAVGLGLAIGLAGAVMLARFLDVQLFQVSGSDPVTLAAAASGLTVVALVAHWFPARRAMTVDPAIALRQD